MPTPSRAPKAVAATPAHRATEPSRSALASHPRSFVASPRVAPRPTLGGGSPLDPALRTRFGARFGADLRDVRVHTDAHAARAAEALRARAFVHGRDVAFARGEFAPHTLRGLAVLAHELVHVVQQSRGGAVVPGGSEEREAHAAAQDALDGLPARVRGAAGAHLALLRSDAPVPTASTLPLPQALSSTVDPRAMSDVELATQIFVTERWLWRHHDAQALAVQQALERMHHERQRRDGHQRAEDVRLRHGDVVVHWATVASTPGTFLSIPEGGRTLTELAAFLFGHEDAHAFHRGDAAPPPALPAGSVLALPPERLTDVAIAHRNRVTRDALWLRYPTLPPVVGAEPADQLLRVRRQTLRMTASQVAATIAGRAHELARRANHIMRLAEEALRAQAAHPTSVAGVISDLVAANERPGHAVLSQAHAEALQAFRTLSDPGVTREAVLDGANRVYRADGLLQTADDAWQRYLARTIEGGESTREFLATTRNVCFSTATMLAGGIIVGAAVTTGAVVTATLAGATMLASLQGLSAAIEGEDPEAIWARVREGALEGAITGATAPIQAMLRGAMLARLSGGGAASSGALARLTARVTAPLLRRLQSLPEPTRGRVLNALAEQLAAQIVSAARTLATNLPTLFLGGSEGRMRVLRALLREVVNNASRGVLHFGLYGLGLRGLPTGAHPSAVITVGAEVASNGAAEALSSTLLHDEHETETDRLGHVLGAMATSAGMGLSAHHDALRRRDDQEAVRRAMAPDAEPARVEATRVAQEPAAAHETIAPQTVPRDTAQARPAHTQAATVRATHAEVAALHASPAEASLQTAAHGIAPTGVPVVRDATLTGRSARVVYTRDRLGMIDHITIVVGPEATASDVRVHALTARELQRFQGVQGAAWQAVAMVSRALRLEGTPRIGSRAWEAMHELVKVPRVIEVRLREFEGAATPEEAAAIAAQVEHLGAQLRRHQETFTARDERAGAGHIAADGTPQVPRVGPELGGHVNLQAYKETLILPAANPHNRLLDSLLPDTLRGVLASNVRRVRPLREYLLGEGRLTPRSTNWNGRVEAFGMLQASEAIAAAQRAPGALIVDTDRGVPTAGRLAQMIESSRGLVFVGGEHREVPRIQLSSEGVNATRSIDDEFDFRSGGEGPRMPAGLRWTADQSMPIVGWDVKSPFGYLTARPTTLAEYRERVMASVSASVDKLMQHDLEANEVEGVRGEGRGVIDLSYIPRSMLSQALVVVLDTLGARAAELLPRLVIVRTFR